MSLAKLRALKDAPKSSSDAPVSASPATVVTLKKRKPQTIRDGEVYCGRNMYMGGWALKGSRWQNPFKVGRDGDIDRVLELYRKHILDTGLVDDIEELRGKVLACWCKPNRCHCDVLVDLLLERTPTSLKREYARDDEGYVVFELVGGRVKPTYDER